MKYVAIVGSNSKNSLNRVLANFLAKRYGSDDLSIDVLSINNLPFYSVDDECNTFSRSCCIQASCQRS